MVIPPLKVNHFDNQMHSTSNNVTISGKKSGAETTLNGAMDYDAATSITLTSGTNFDDTSESFLETHQILTSSKLMMRLFLIINLR